MKQNPQNVDDYVQYGCGRCPLGGTPQCKVHTWHNELQQLRKILLQSQLSETIKWSVPCYTIANQNVILLNAFKDYCALNFIKGSLMTDPNGILTQPTENTQATRQIRFTNTQEIEQLRDILQHYIQEAIAIEQTGTTIHYKKISEFPIPTELQQHFDEDFSFKMAFENLSAGRQRGYLLYFAAPKNSSTRHNRITKCIPQILAGKGLQD
ncbi:MAG: DUF1801 domain-containing protein [Chitinophagales bacterium]|jgi:uncharacterized protein YdeI (YjbR/CyaY-like superfamily)|nr:DUF1801 domain-containing protein [Chitinophagales bacterium]